MLLQTEKVLTRHEFTNSLLPADVLLERLKDEMRHELLGALEPFTQWFSNEELDRDIFNGGTFRWRAAVNVLTPDQARALRDLLIALEKGYPAAMLTGVLSTLERVFGGGGQRKTRVAQGNVEVPKPHRIYRHFKGTDYLVLSLERSADGTPVVRYRRANDLNDVPWNRNLAEFQDEVQDDDGVWVPRFKRLQ